MWKPVISLKGPNNYHPSIQELLTPLKIRVEERGKRGIVIPHLDSKGGMVGNFLYDCT